MTQETRNSSEDTIFRYTAILRIVSAIIVTLIILLLNFGFHLEIHTRHIFFLAVLGTGFILLNLMILMSGIRLLDPVARIFLIILVTYIIYIFGGIRANSLIAGYIMIIAFTGVLQPQLVTAYTTGFTIICYLTLVVLQFNRVIQPPPIYQAQLENIGKQYYIVHGTLNCVFILLAAYVAISIVETLKKKSEGASDHSSTMVQDMRRQTGELRRTQTHLDRLINSVREFAVFSVDTKGRIVSFSEGSRGIFGWAPEEVEGAHISILKGEDDPDFGSNLLERTRKLFSSSRKVDQLSDRRVMLLRKDKTAFTAELAVSPIIIDEEREGFIIIIHNITEKEEIERKLRMSQRRYKGFVDALRDSLFTLDAEGSFVWANEYFIELSGYSLEQLVQEIKPGKIFIFTDDQDQKLHDLASWVSDISLVNRDGQHIPVSVTMSTIKDDGENIGAVGLVKDLSQTRQNEQYLETYTRQLQDSKSEIEKVNKQLVDQQIEIRRSKDELEKLNKVKNAFLTNLSQELKTPLIAGMGYIDLILSGDAGTVTPDALNYMQISHRNFKKLGLMIDNLLTMAKFTEAQQTPEFSVISLAERIPHWLDDEIRGKTMSLAVQIPPPVSKVMGDDFLLAKVFDNLANFARTQSFNRPTVLITATARPNRMLEIVFTIEDLVLPRETVDHVFDGLLDSDETKVSRAGILGIGLSIVHNILELHGGAIDVSSREGEGTAFKLALRRHMA